MVGQSCRLFGPSIRGLHCHELSGSLNENASSLAALDANAIVIAIFNAKRWSHEKNEKTGGSTHVDATTDANECYASYAARAVNAFDVHATSYVAVVSAPRRQVLVADVPDVHQGQEV